MIILVIWKNSLKLTEYFCSGWFTLKCQCINGMEVNLNTAIILLTQFEAAIHEIKIYIQHAGHLSQNFLSLIWKENHNLLHMHSVQSFEIVLIDIRVNLSILITFRSQSCFYGNQSSKLIEIISTVRFLEPLPLYRIQMVRMDFSNLSEIGYS